MRYRSLLLLLLLAACNASGRPDGQSAPYTSNTLKAVPGTYVVVPGDTVSAIAERTNSTVLTIIELNHLEPPFIIRPGQVLRISGETQPDAAPVGAVTVKKLPGSTGAATRNNAVAQNQFQPRPYTAPASSNVAAKPLVPAPVVAPLPAKPVPVRENTAQTAAVTPAKAPTVTAPAPASVGPNQKTIVTSATSQANQPLPRPATSAPAPAVPVSVKPVKSGTAEEEVSSSPPPVQQASLEPADVPLPGPANAGSALPSQKTEQFSWPIKGDLIAKFGPDAQGLKNDGINIAAPSGTPVKAVNDGEVAYAGNELRGFGNLVLIRHADGWITAYAHNDSLMVKKGDKVKRGQIIAKVGQTGNVASPQLHFELRKGAQAVDPLPHLQGQS